MAHIAHPDHGGSNEEFIKISNARYILLDPEMRAVYDRDGMIGLK